LVGDIAATGDFTMADSHITGGAEASGDRIARAFIGGALLGLSSRRPGRWRAITALAGAGLLAEALSRATVHSIERAGEARRTVHLHTAIHIGRPVHDVFVFCKDFENFPRIVGALRQVTDFQDGRSHWVAATPSGGRLEWDAVVTKYVPNCVIGWHSVPGSSVESSGIMRFAPAPDGGTRVEVDLRYTPHDTGLGDALLAIADTPRTRQLEHDLERMSTYLEQQPVSTE
jgi:uncharacterized membrane protein